MDVVPWASLSNFATLRVVDKFTAGGGGAGAPVRATSLVARSLQSRIPNPEKMLSKWIRKNGHYDPEAQKISKRCACQTDATRTTGMDAIVDGPTGAAAATCSPGLWAELIDGIDPDR